MADFSSFFPATGGGGGGVIINNFQTGTAPIDFNQLQALAIVDSAYASSNGAGNYNIDYLNTYPGQEKGEGDFQLTYPEDVLNTYTTIKEVTNATNGGAFCYASFLHRSNNNVSNLCGGDISIKVTLDGTAHVVNYKPTAGISNHATSICQLGYATVRSISTTTSGHAIESPFPYQGKNIGYGVYWDAVTSTTTTTFDRPNFTPQNAGTTSAYSITTAIPATGVSYDLDADGFPILISGNGSFQGDTGGNNAGVLIDSRNYSVTVASATTGGSIKITVTGAATVNANGSLTIPMLSTRLAGDNNRFTGKMNFQSSQAFAQQTVRSSNFDDIYSDSNSSVGTHFHDPKVHVSMGAPWVKFETSCKVEMSHSQEPSNYSYNGYQYANVGIYEF
tara:strand:- start:717 stop:1889 length:1173 start_codon:yes stop_codon:yes gene_type:complete